MQFEARPDPATRPPALWQRMGALALGGLLLTAVFTLGGCETRAAVDSDLRLLYTATLHGYIEPCGCTKGKTGGIDRVATAMRDHMAEHPGALFVDGGDLFSDRMRMDDHLQQQAALKADEIFGIWSELGCAAMALGDFDLALGVEALQDLSARHSIPILSANVIGPDGGRPFAESVVVERNGLRVGIFSLLNANLKEAYAKDGEPKVHPVLKRVRELGYDLEPWRDAAARVIEDLAPRTDLLLCASHLGFEANRQLAELHPQLDLIFGGHTDNQPQPYEVVAGTPVASSEIKGARINRIDLWVDDDYLAQEARRGLTDVSRWIVPRVAYDVTARGLVMIEGRRNAVGEAEWVSRRMGLTSANREALRRIEELGELPSGPLFSYSTVALPMSALRDESALAAISRYHDRLDEHWAAQPQETRHPNVRYVGAETCYDCHAEQYEFWKSTQHSRAFATLEATRQHRDVECIGCHTVGFQKPRGFDHPSASAGFENVQCAACHGGGGPHMTNPLRYFEPGRLTEAPQQTCIGCHNDEHDPRFRGEAAARLAKVTCPPMSNATFIQPALVDAYAAGALAAEEQEPVDWALASRLWTMAGDPGRSLDAARAWAEDEPRSIPVRANLAERLLLAGEFDEALEAAEWIIGIKPSFGRAWTVKAAILVKLDDDQAALNACREAYSINPGDWANARLLAEASAKVGDRMGAVDVLRAHLQSKPQDEVHLAPLLAELLGMDD